MKEIPDLGKSRDREYPVRCDKCFLVKELCICGIRSYRMGRAASGVKFHDQKRIWMAVYN